MSARFPTTIHVSFERLAQRGGGTGPHRDGWGIAFAQDGDALVVREPEPASASPWVAFLGNHDVRSATVLAHIRKATQGPRTLRNTQPFARELAGRVHLFAHNGMLPGIEDDERFRVRRFRRVGDTDSEHAFCALLDRLAPKWEHGVPEIDVVLAEVSAFARTLRTLGPANFIYTDGDAIFAHGHRRRTDAGEIRPPGLHLLCRSCSATSEDSPRGAITIPPEASQEVALLASVPLTMERWEPLGEGEVVVLREGRVIRRKPCPRNES
jgi:glutamine amidotransferase